MAVRERGRSQWGDPRATADSKLILPGLTQDDEKNHAERIRFWDNFNVCWLAMLQRQKDDTQQVLDSGRPPAQPQSLLPKEFLEEMGNELVSLCDGLEKHGLVDYQMGVSEQEIIESKPKSTSIYPDRHESCTLWRPGSSYSMHWPCWQWRRERRRSRNKPNGRPIWPRYWQTMSSRSTIAAS